MHARSVSPGRSARVSPAHSDPLSTQPTPISQATQVDRLATNRILNAMGAKRLELRQCCQHKSGSRSQSRAKTPARYRREQTVLSAIPRQDGRGVQRRKSPRSPCRLRTQMRPQQVPDPPDRYGHRARVGLQVDLAAMRRARPRSRACLHQARRGSRSVRQGRVCR
jgi:hypothetical protein